MAHVKPAKSPQGPARSPAKSLKSLTARSCRDFPPQSPAKSRKVLDFQGFQRPQSPTRKVPPLRGKAWRAAACGPGLFPLWFWGREITHKQSQRAIPHARLPRSGPR